MKTAVFLLIVAVAVHSICYAAHSAQVSVMGAVKIPQAVQINKPISLHQVLAECGGVIKTGWTRTIIVTMRESDVLTSTRKYELQSLSGELLEKKLKQILIYPGEVIFVQERVD